VVSAVKWFLTLFLSRVPLRVAFRGASFRPANISVLF